MKKYFAILVLIWIVAAVAGVFLGTYVLESIQTIS